MNAGATLFDALDRMDRQSTAVPGTLFPTDRRSLEERRQQTLAILGNPRWRRWPDWWIAAACGLTVDDVVALRHPPPGTSGAGAIPPAGAKMFSQPARTAADTGTSKARPLLENAPALFPLG
jgi:hypothetical protein